MPIPALWRIRKAICEFSLRLSKARSELKKKAARTVLYLAAIGVFAAVSVFCPFATRSEAECGIERSSLTVSIDAGHQARENAGQEPIGPGAKTTKPKVSPGTAGVSTRVPEYKLTLAVSLKLRDELVARGYNVFMVRETNDVNISNRERANMAAEALADIFVRIHADGDENPLLNGILVLSPTEDNPYIPGLYGSSYALSKCILDAMAAETGAKNRGVSKVDNMSGINWSTMPVTLVEMGLMTNPAEDRLMQTEAYQLKLAIGIANGIDDYFMVGSR
jgi:N-acetylmuramoyl-L-alanine amidase